MVAGGSVSEVGSERRLVDARGSNGAVKAWDGSRAVFHTGGRAVTFSSRRVWGLVVSWRHERRDAERR